MSAYDATDHDLLILLNRDMSELKDQHRDAMDQLKRGNDRFATIAMRDQELGAAIAGLRLDFSRAIQIAEQAREGVGKVQSQIDDFKLQIRTVLWLGGPLIGISVALASELIKRWLGL